MKKLILAVALAIPMTAAAEPSDRQVAREAESFYWGADAVSIDKALMTKGTEFGYRYRIKLDNKRTIKCTWFKSEGFTCWKG